MKYFPLLYKLRGEERYLIWVSNEKTSLAAHRGGFLPSFGSLKNLREYAGLKEYTLEAEEPRMHDLDWVASWVDEPTKRVDCVRALLAWNLFDDVAASVTAAGFGVKNERSKSIYEKLFWGNNLPSMTPAGKKYIPKWSREEIGSLADVLKTGLRLFTSFVRSWPEELGHKRAKSGPSGQPERPPSRPRPS